MKPRIPEASVDELLTREEFDAALKKYVNEENARIIGQVCDHVQNTNVKVIAHAAELIQILLPLSLVDPQYAAKISDKVKAILDTYTELSGQLNLAHVCVEATNATKH